MSASSSTAAMAKADSYVLRRHVFFLLFIAGSCVILLTPLRQLLFLSQNTDYASHIRLIPLVSAFLIYRSRHKIFSTVPAGGWKRGAFLIVGLALLFGASVFWRISPKGLTIETAVLVVSWIVGFTLYYGAAAFRRALFPLFFLILMVPIPEFLHTRVVTFLQNASAIMSFALLKTVHATVFREGLLLRFPSIDIEVAPECSGIRSSLALLITILLTGEFVLRSVWSKAVLVLAVVPVAILKNAIRIATISLLTVYVNPAYIHSWIHKSGGMVFYALALLVYVPLVLVLRHLETRLQK